MLAPRSRGWSPGLGSGVRADDVAPALAGMSPGGPVVRSCTGVTAAGRGWRVRLSMRCVKRGVGFWYGLKVRCATGWQIICSRYSRVHGSRVSFGRCASVPRTSRSGIHGVGEWSLRASVAVGSSGSASCLHAEWLGDLPPGPAVGSLSIRAQLPRLTRRFAGYAG